MWRVEVDLVADEAFLPVYVVRDRERIEFSRPWRSAAGRALTVAVRFAPVSWAESDEVRVGVEICTAAVTDAALKADPRPRAAVAVAAGDTLATGAVWPLASVDEHGVVVALGLVAKPDTEGVRGRWRLREPHHAALPRELAFLATGTQAGVSPLS